MKYGPPLNRMPGLHLTIVKFPVSPSSASNPLNPMHLRRPGGSSPRIHRSVPWTGIENSTQLTTRNEAPSQWRMKKPPVF